MMLFRCTVALAFLVAGPLVFACERNEYGVFEDSSCASAAFDDAQKKMNDTYQQLLAHVRPEARDALRLSQVAWEKYRHSVATFTYAQEGDGSAGRLIVMNDQERAMRARTEELVQWLARN